MPRDFTKYNFNGQILGKGRLVLAVIKEFVKQNQPTLAELFKAFPVEVQGKKGLFCTEQEFNEKLKTSDDVKKRFFTKDDEILDIEGTKVLVSTQWGEGNIADFIGQAESQGFYITELEGDGLSGVTRIWKVSHSPNSINTEQRMWLEENSLLAVHKNTGNGSVPCFEQMSKGDIVSLGYGNQVAKIVKVISDIETQADSPLGNDWLLRSYETIKGLPAPIKYKGKHKRWSPRFNGTSWEVPKNEYWMFEEEVLQPYYALTLKDLGFDSSQISRPTNLSSSVEVMNTVSLNQILYGPPGTGKTYHSIHAAVKAAEPEMFNALGIDESFGTTPEQRSELTRLYKELYNSGRIRFVTFHQSYGYEEFVEGLSAKTEDKQITYFEKSGVFKELSNKAKDNLIDSKKPLAQLTREQEFEQILEQFKLEIFEQLGSDESYPITEKCFILDVAEDGFIYGNEAWPINHKMLFSHLKALYLENVESRKDVVAFSKEQGGMGKARAHASYFFKVVEELQRKLPRNDIISANVMQRNYVLIIDEINRGNISKIFGELITLIEPSKRLGHSDSEAIEVTLPYSGDKFSVPDNLYIIGTMNTADRSLALMDTALRRRFDFIEMMPDYNVLHNEEGSSFKVESDGFEIDLARLLETMNKRIAALYDREHQLGHAFLMPVVKAIAAGDDEKALHELKSCFQNKIIPLLAEYFFEDWQKIRLVVGDNQKPEAYQLINQSDVDFDALFGDTEDVGDVADEVQDFRLIKSDSERWTDPLTYIGIYSAGSLTFSNQDEG
ncbi:AAA family ATPase [Pseudoalteromonas sp. 1CM17D]|uniref:McrB family protein n=1 Tax=Pseudoalteromonas sp. 1CM17D TaxID=2929162 RepID=UPI0020C07B7F|nr:AAA family ATPase [Pseudoalteromonas sp. 1CM17D]MCK8094566.1 AAA family ATPase [Pseudoalteromonas sp. 1CM17D]